MPIRALFRGPRHIVHAVSEEFARLAGMEVIGRPVSELWIDPDAQRAQAAMDATYVDGEPRLIPDVISTDGVMGSVLVAAWRVGGRIAGVGVDWQPSNPSIPPTPVGALVRRSERRER